MAVYLSVSPSLFLSLSLSIYIYIGGGGGAALSRSGDLEINISYEDTLIGNCCAAVCLYMHVCRVSARIITFCLVGLANIPYTVMSCVIIWGSNLMIARLLDA